MSSPVGYPQRNAYPMFSSTSQGDVPVGKNGANLIPVMASTPSSGGIGISAGGRVIPALLADPTPPAALWEDAVTCSANDVIRMGGGYIKQIRCISGSAMVALNDSPDLTGRQLWSGTITASDIVDINLAVINGASVSITGTATIMTTHGDLK